MSWLQIAFLSLGFTALLLCKLLFLSIISSEPVSSAPLFSVLSLWDSPLTSAVCGSFKRFPSSFLPMVQSSQFPLRDDTIGRCLRCQTVGYCNILVTFYQNKAGKENLSTAWLHLNNSALPLSFSCTYLISSHSSPGPLISKTFHGPRALAMTFLGFVFFLLIWISV